MPARRKGEGPDWGRSPTFLVIKKMGVLPLTTKPSATCAMRWRHRDKDWQMTDCLSFAAMRQQHLREALTGDHHFEQAGFKILFH